MTTLNHVHTKEIEQGGEPWIEIVLKQHEMTAVDWAKSSISYASAHGPRTQVQKI